MQYTTLGDYSTLPAELWDHIKVANFLWDTLRSIGYMLLKGLAKLIDETYEAVNFVLSLDLYTLVKNEYPDVFAVIPAIVWSLFALMLMIVGFKLAASRDKSETGRTAKGILTAALWIVALPTFINVLGDLQQAGINDVDSVQVGSGSTLGESILSSLVIDIDNSKTAINHPSNAYQLNINEVLDNEGFWDKKLGTIADDNGLYYSNTVSALVLQEVFGVPQGIVKDFYRSGGTAENSFTFYQVKTAAVNATGDESILGCTSLTELFLMPAYRDEVNTFIDSYDPSSYVSTINSYNTYLLFTKDDYEMLDTLEKIERTIESGFTPIEYLYAYDFYFVNGLLVMLTTLISLLFAGFKGGKLLYDLVFNQIIAPIVIATDLQETGRAKKTIQQLISTYLIFIVILFLIKIYLMVVLYVINAQYNLIVQIILILAGMAFVIDGPDFVVQILGIDAGVKSGMHALAGVHAGLGVARTAAGIGSSTANFAKKAAEKVGKPAEAAYDGPASDFCSGLVGSHISKESRTSDAASEESINSEAEPPTPATDEAEPPTPATDEAEPPTPATDKEDK